MSRAGSRFRCSWTNHGAWPLAQGAVGGARRALLAASRCRLISGPRPSSAPTTQDNLARNCVGAQVTLLTDSRRERTFSIGADVHLRSSINRSALMSEETTLTMSVPAAGKKYFGLSRNGAYDAAARGDLPTIRIGRLLRVPVRALEKMLDRAGEAAV